MRKDVTVKKEKSSKKERNGLWEMWESRRLFHISHRPY